MLDLGELNQAMVDHLRAGMYDLGLKAVHYGDINMIGPIPCIAVIPRQVDHVPTDTYMQALDDGELHIFLYHDRLQNVRDNLKECLEYTKTVKEYILTENQLGGLVVFSWISQQSIGQTTFNNDDLLVSSRLVWMGRTRTPFR